MIEQGGKRDVLAQMSHFVSRESAYHAVGGVMGTFSTAVLKSAKPKAPSGDGSQFTQWLRSVCPQRKTLGLMFLGGTLATLR